MQLTEKWDELYRTNTTAWEDDEVAPATQRLIRAHLTPGHSILEIGCGRGIDSVWMAEQGYQVTACDVSPTAVRAAEARAKGHAVAIDFRVADVLRDHTSLPRCDVVFERGVFHTFTTDAGRSLFARVIAGLLDTGSLWLSLSGLASTLEEAVEAVSRREARVSASQITEAVEPFFGIVSMTRTIYGFPGGQTDFPALASVFRRRG